jgi:hypothetical protein
MCGIKQGIDIVLHGLHSIKTVFRLRGFFDGGLGAIL